MGPMTDRQMRWAFLVSMLAFAFAMVDVFVDFPRLLDQALLMGSTAMTVVIINKSWLRFRLRHPKRAKS